MNTKNSTDAHKLIFQINKSDSMRELSQTCDAVLAFEKKIDAKPLDVRMINDALQKKLAVMRGRFRSVKIKIQKSLINELDMLGE